MARPPTIKSVVVTGLNSFKIDGRTRGFFSDINDALAQSLGWGFPQQQFSKFATLFSSTSKVGLHLKMRFVLSVVNMCRLS